MDVEDEQAVEDRAELNEACYADEMEDEDVQNFRCNVKNEAFLLSCKLSVN